MINQIDFLRKKAMALRNLTERAPNIGDALRRLADELDAKAAELEQNSGDPPTPQAP